MYKSFLKRLLDLFISFIGIIVLLCPTIVIAILIKVDSKGPVFFTQKRLGKNKKQFTIFKFRTMCVNAYENGGIATSESDIRITKIGKVLRRTSIDELPQLINIFLGHMSIIGPRPILDWEYDEYAKGEYEDRFLLRPGLFCTVDVIARNAERDRQFFMDAEYCKNCTFVLDVQTLIRVIEPVLSGKGVYRDESEGDVNALPFDTKTSR